MNGGSNVRWFFCRDTRENDVLSILDKKYILAISQDAASVGAVHKFIAISDVPEKFLYTVHGPEIVFHFTLCTSDLVFGHYHFQRGAWFFIVACPEEVVCVFSGDTSLSYSLSRDFA